MREIDLHVHTTASDGTCTPAEVVALAHNIGLKAVAITDHDTAQISHIVGINNIIERGGAILVKSVMFLFRRVLHLLESLFHFIRFL